MAESNNPVSPGIPFEVNREVLHLSPNPAEGKALQRIHSPILEAEWITVFDPKEYVIDASEANAWLEELNRTGWVTAEESVALSLNEIYKTQKFAEVHNQKAIASRVNGKLPVAGSSTGFISRLAKLSYKTSRVIFWRYPATTGHH